MNMNTILIKNQQTVYEFDIPYRHSNVYQERHGYLH